MQRRHYNAIAAALRSGNTSHFIVDLIADILSTNNSKFDFDKFITKALRGPTQEQRSAKYIRTLATHPYYLAYLTRGKSHATPRHNSAAIAEQTDGVGPNWWP